MKHEWAQEKKTSKSLASKFAMACWKSVELKNDFWKTEQQLSPLTVGQQEVKISFVRSDSTVNSLLTKNSTSRHFSIPILPFSQTLYLYSPLSGRSLINGRRHFWKLKLDFSFVYASSISGHPTYNWLLAMKFVFNLQFKQNYDLWQSNRTVGSVLSNLHLSAGKQAVSLFDMNKESNMYL